MVETYTLFNISYVKASSSTAVLVDSTNQIEGQTALPETAAHIAKRSFPTSTRNGANAYIVPTEADKLYLNFIAQKTHITSKTYNNVIRPEFTYFVDVADPIPDPFTLADGIFFRCASDIPLDKEDHTYYLITDGTAKKIPDYKTLEVMLAERNQNLLSVRVLEAAQCRDIPKASGSLSSKESVWSEDMADATTIETLKKMQEGAKSAGAMVEAAKGEVQKQIDAVKAQAAASKAEAEAEKAKADAARAEADAAKAQAEAEKAEATQKQAEAEAEKAKYEGK